MSEQEDLWYLPATIKTEAGTKIKAGQVVKEKDGKVYPASKTANDAD